MSAPALLFTVAGTDRTAFLRRPSLRISDILNEQPNTAQMRVAGFTPTKGQEIKIGLGGVTTLAQLLFAGHILKVKQVYESAPVNVAYDLECIDYTWKLGHRMVTKRYLSMTATAIITDILTFAPAGFTTVNVTAGLPAIDEISFTWVSIPDAISRVMERVGGYWYVDDLKDVHAFLTETGGPTSITDADTQGVDGLTFEDDVSQIRTRVYVEGGGANAEGEIAVGATTLPISDPVWYDAGGGSVVAGPQKITYTGISTQVISTGTPIAEPTTNLVGTVNGSGRLAGTYLYKYIFHNGAGETLGSTASASVAPVGTPTPGAPTAAVSAVEGVMVGAYKYKASYVTALGETVVGSASGTASPAAAAPPNTVGGSSVTTTVSPLLTGNYGWGVTFVNAQGETLMGTPGTTSLTTLTPTRTLTAGGTTGGAMTLLGVYKYKVTMVSPWGETTGGTEVSKTLTGSQNAVSITSLSIGPTGTTARRIYRTTDGGTNHRLVTEIGDNSTTTYTDTSADADLGEAIPGTNTFGGPYFTVNSIQTGPTGTLARNLYRTKKNGSLYYFLAQIPNNTTTTYADLIPDSSLAIDEPLVNTAGGQKVSLTSIPTASASAGVLARRLYRTKAGGTEYFYLDQLSDNSTTTYTDNIPDTSLTQHVPLVGTAGGQKVDLTSIDVGPAGTTSRRLYRTLPSGADYFYLAAINDNTATIYTDNVPDDNLGQPIPTVNTTAGAPVTTSILTGVPASGAGSVVYVIPNGDPINLLVQRDDVAAQTALAALIGGDGISEYYMQDRRLSQTEAEARGDAQLAMFKSALQQLTYRNRDPLAKSGKSITVTLGAPTSISTTQKIQSVTVSQVQVGAPGTSEYPMYDVVASSQLYRFEDILRQITSGQAP